MSVEDLKTALANYEDILSFEEVGDFIKVTMEYQPGPKGKATWEAVNEQVKQFGGEWKSVGRGSHWAVPRKTAKAPQKAPELTLLGRLELVRDELDSIISQVREASS